MLSIAISTRGDPLLFFRPGFPAVQAQIKSTPPTPAGKAQAQQQEHFSNTVLDSIIAARETVRQGFISQLTQPWGSETPGAINQGDISSVHAGLSTQLREMHWSTSLLARLCVADAMRMGAQALNWRRGS